MLTHVVFFKLKDKSSENIEKAKEIIMRVEGKVPTLRSIKVGADIIHSERSFDLALIATFDSLEGMDAYQVHPVHVDEVLANLRPMLEASAAVDFVD